MKQRKWYQEHTALLVLVSYTPFQSVGWGFDYDKTELEMKNVLFQYDDKPSYVRQMMENVLAQENDYEGWVVLWLLRVQ